MLVTASEALVTADPKAATELFERAVSGDELRQWPFDLARVRLCFAEHLRRTRVNDEARRQLELARAVFVRLGAVPWLARVDAEAQELTERPSQAGAGEIAGLTAKEYEVAQLAARGLTNKQIGAQLFLSPRTVGTYLYRAFPKLGITTRAALRDALSGRVGDGDSTGLL
jgi:DNA-binding CsgD family transcriptional regulator